MKRLILLLLVCIFALPNLAFADVDIDLSKMTLDELTALRERIDKEIINRTEWKEITLSEGVWKVGTDIPTGHWTVTASKNSLYGWGAFTYCDKLDATGKKVDIFSTSFYYSGQVRLPDVKAAVQATEIDIEINNDGFIIIEHGVLVFSPYVGKKTFKFQ